MKNLSELFIIKQPSEVFIQSDWDTYVYIYVLHLTQVDFLHLHTECMTVVSRIGVGEWQLE